MTFKTWDFRGVFKEDYEGDFEGYFKGSSIVLVNCRAQVRPGQIQARSRSDRGLLTFTEMCAGYEMTQQKMAEPCRGPRGLNFGWPEDPL